MSDAITVSHIFVVYFHYQSSMVGMVIVIELVTTPLVEPSASWNNLGSSPNFNLLASWKSKQFRIISEIFVQCELPCPCVLKLPAQIGLTIRTAEWFKHNNVVRNWLTNAAYISHVRIDLEVVTATHA